MKRLGLGILASVLLCWAEGEGNSPHRVSIPDRVQVKEDLLTLGHIARIQPPSALLSQVPLGYAPYAGHYRWLSQEDVRLSLRKAGVDPNSLRLEMGDRVLLTRGSQAVPEEQVRGALEDFLRAAFPQLEVQIRSLELPREVILPTGQLRVQVDPHTQLPRLDQVSLKVEFWVDGKLERSQWVRAELEAWGESLAAARDLSYGTRLSPADVRLTRRRITRLEDFATDPESVIGQVTRRPIREGELLTEADLRKPVLVQRGDVVTVIVKGKAFQVSSLARSHDAGGLGDSVRVENLESRKKLTAVVVGEKQVQVPVPEALP